MTKIKASNFDTGSVGTDALAADAVTAAKITDGAVTSDGLADDAVTATKIATGAVDSGTDWQSVQTASFTAVAGKGYPVNTTSGAITITLPASPSVGDFIQVVDYAGTFQTNALTIAASGSDKIEGEALSFAIKAQRAGATITYVDATQGWVATSRVTADAIQLGTSPVETLVIGGGGSGGDNYDGGGGAGGRAPRD